MQLPRERLAEGGARPGGAPGRESGGADAPRLRTLLPVSRFLRVVVVASLLLVTQVAAAGPQPRVRLFGVVVRDAGGTALLSLGDGRPQRLHVGESLSGYTLIEVAPDGVVLRHPSRALFSVRFPDRKTPAAEIPRAATVTPEPVETRPAAPTEFAAPIEFAAPTDAPPPSGAPRDGVRRFSRDEVRLRLATDLPRILAGAVVAPRVRGNDVVGLELISFPTDTLLGETGLAAGDVLMEVNGREVRGMESLAVLVQRFQTARELELRVDRAGEVFSLRYFIE